MSDIVVVNQLVCGSRCALREHHMLTSYGDRIIDVLCYHVNDIYMQTMSTLDPGFIVVHNAPEILHL